MAELTQTQLDYIDWRANPERQGAKRAWAEEHGTSETTLQRWDKTAWFRDGLDKKLAQLNVSPDRMQAILDRLHNEAKGGDVAAAKAYMQWVSVMMPDRTRVEDVSIESLTDDELRLAFEEGLAARATA